ncbi:MAG: TetR family transcriptional regulator [Planctomycetota bacterium]
MSESVRGRPREFDADVALEAALQLFWAQGFEATGVSELCEAMGIGKQSMYDWSGGKRGLYMKAIERYNEKYLCGLGPHLNAPGSPLGNILHCLHAMAEMAKMPSSPGCFLTNTRNEFGTSDEEIKRVTERLERYIIDSFCEALERARDAGEIPATTDCRAKASVIAVVRNGIMLAGRAGQSAESIDETIAMIEVTLKSG